VALLRLSTLTDSDSTASSSSNRSLSGQAFLAERRALVTAAENAQEVADQAEAGLIGTLRVGVVTSALSHPLLGALHAFRSTRLRVELQLTEVDTGWGQQPLLRHEIDIAVIRPRTPTRGLRIRPWRHEEFVLALPSKARRPGTGTAGGC
jgi:DNA-binding transcriptional LysR family regulator